MKHPTKAESDAQQGPVRCTRVPPGTVDVLDLAVRAVRALRGLRPLDKPAYDDPAGWIDSAPLLITHWLTAPAWSPATLEPAGGEAHQRPTGRL